jgi:hypothetical protein
MKVVPLVLLLLVVSLVGCGTTCDNAVLSQAVSPSGSLKAVAFSRTCGATTSVNVQVSILRAGSTLQDGEGSALIADGAELGSLKWKGEDTVEVTFSKEPRVFKLNPVDGVRVVTSATSL